MIQRLSQKPGFFPLTAALRNRVSSQNLGIDTEIITETRFLSPKRGSEKPPRAALRNRVS
ncbi:MAG: hypothetical protein ACRCT1_13855 [Microcoleaceae cyanobacterium]